jgi:hypothetical protein
MKLKLKLKKNKFNKLFLIPYLCCLNTAVLVKYAIFYQHHINYIDPQIGDYGSFFMLMIAVTGAIFMIMYTFHYVIETVKGYKNEKYKDHKTEKYFEEKW